MIACRQTGLLVSPTMNHGGPFPATGHPGFMAVGIPASLLRFDALQSTTMMLYTRLSADCAMQEPAWQDVA